MIDWKLFCSEPYRSTKLRLIVSREIGCFLSQGIQFSFALLRVLYCDHCRILSHEMRIKFSTEMKCISVFSNKSCLSHLFRRGTMQIYLCDFWWRQQVAGLSLKFASCWSGWGERYCPKSATAIHLVARGSNTNLSIERQTLYQWAMEIYLYYDSLPSWFWLSACCSCIRANKSHDHACDFPHEATFSHMLVLDWHVVGCKRQASKFDLSLKRWRLAAAISHSMLESSRAWLLFVVGSNFSLKVFCVNIFFSCFTRFSWTKKVLRSAVSLAITFMSVVPPHQQSSAFQLRRCNSCLHRACKTRTNFVSSSCINNDTHHS